MSDRFVLESVKRGDKPNGMASLRVILAWSNHGTWQQQDISTLQLLTDVTQKLSY